MRIYVQTSKFLSVAAANGSAALPALTGYGTALIGLLGGYAGTPATATAYNNSVAGSTLIGTGPWRLGNVVRPGASPDGWNGLTMWSPDNLADFITMQSSSSVGLSAHRMYGTSGGKTLPLPGTVGSANQAAVVLTYSNGVNPDVGGSWLSIPRATNGSSWTPSGFIERPGFGYDPVTLSGSDGVVFSQFGPIGSTAVPSNFRMLQHVCTGDYLNAFGFTATDVNTAIACPLTIQLVGTVTSSIDIDNSVFNDIYTGGAALYLGSTVFSHNGVGTTPFTSNAVPSGIPTVIPTWQGTTIANQRVMFTNIIPLLANQGVTQLTGTYASLVPILTTAGAPVAGLTAALGEYITVSLNPIASSGFVL